MKRSSSSFVVVSLLLGLGGCAVSVPNVALDKTHRPPIKSVALLAVDEPIVQARDVSGSGGAAGVAAFGLIGAIVGANIDASHNEVRHKQLHQALDERHVEFGPIMVSTVQAQLQNAGIATEYLPDVKATLTPDKKNYDYSGVKTDKDAILHLAFGGFGFIDEERMTAKYQPWVQVNAELIDPKTKAVIYQKTFNVGYQPKIKKAEFLELEAKDDDDDRYEFGNFDNLMKRFDLGVAALTDGESLVAARVASEIK